METTMVKYKWWRIFSPCLIASVVLFIGIMECLMASHQGKGLEFFAAALCAVFILVLQTLDGVLKVWVKPSTFILWIVEIVLIVGIPPLFLYTTSGHVFYFSSF